MGGSGGFLGKINPESFIRKVRKMEEESADSEFNTEVNNIIGNLLTTVNNRPVEDIQRHLDRVKSAISSELESTIDLVFGGSVSKHTYVNGLSDIDSLAILNNTILSNKDPKEVLDYFYNTLKRSLPNTEISKGQLAITIVFSDKTQIQILPAIKTKTGIKIAASDGSNEWSTVIKPRKFAEKLTEINSNNLQKVVPIIKLAKAIISKLPENRRISGYHAESLAIEAFKHYNGSKTLKDLLKHYFSFASTKVLTQINDRTGQSIHVDDYLGGNNSIPRQIVSDSFAQILRRMQNADGSKNIELWKSILD